MKKIIYMPFFLPFVIILFFMTKGEINFTKEYPGNTNLTENPEYKGSGPNDNNYGQEKDID